MKQTFITWLLFLCAALLSAGTDPQFLLVKDGKAAAAFCAEKPLSPGMRKNIDDFNSALKKVTGTPLPVITETGNSALNRIELVTEKKASSSTEDQFLFEFPNSRTMRIRGTERAVWYGLRTILIRHAGINYLWRDHDDTWIHYPEKSTVSLPRKDDSYTPSLPHMRLIWGLMRGCKRHSWFKGDERMMHNFPTQIFPVSKYAPDKWPEAIMPVINGKKMKLTDSCPKGDPRRHRAFSQWNPCYSAPETVAEAVANIEELLKKEPDLKILGLFPNDNTPQCTCEKCRAVLKTGNKYNSIGIEHYSDLYYRWANAVAEQICRNHPDLILVTGTYLQMTDPPSFKLHKNLLPLICFETWSALRDETVGAKRDKMLKEWRSKTSFFGMHDYHFGLQMCGLPRFYLEDTAAYYRKLYRMGLRAADPEMGAYSSLEGPKERFEDELFWNINVDAKKFLQKWCDDAVGEEAGKDLYEFYDFWQKYWMREELKESSWYLSVNNIYMGIGDQTCVRALNNGELKKLDDLLNRARRKVRTPAQKRRIEIICKEFAIVRDLMTLYFAEPLPCSGILKNREQALAVLDNVIPAQDALERLKKVKRLDLYGGKKYQNTFYAALSTLHPFAHDPVVRERMKKMMAEPKLLPAIRNMFGIMLGEPGHQNLLKYGSCEDRNGFPGTKLKVNTTLSDKVFSEGKGSVKLAVNRLAEFEDVPIQAGKVYYFSMKYRLEGDRRDGRLLLQLIPFNDDHQKNYEWREYILPGARPGKWFRYEVAFAAPAPDHRIFGKPSNALHIRVLSRQFQTPVYVDDMKLICLDSVK